MPKFNHLNIDYELLLKEIKKLNFEIVDTDDLHKLIRNFIKHKCDHDQICKICNILHGLNPEIKNIKHGIRDILSVQPMRSPVFSNKLKDYYKIHHKII